MEKTKSVHKGVVKFSKYKNEGILLDHTKNSFKYNYKVTAPARHGTARHGTARHGTARHGKPSSKGGKVKPSQTQTDDLSS